MCDVETLWMKRPWPTGGLLHQKNTDKLIITVLIMIVQTSTELYLPVLYSQQPVTVSCSELADYILTLYLLWFILRLFFHLLLFRRIASDILFTHTSHDSFYCHPSIYIHISWFILISCPPIYVSVFGLHLPPFHSTNFNVILVSISDSYNSFWLYSSICVLFSQMSFFSNKWKKKHCCY